MNFPTLLEKDIQLSTRMRVADEPGIKRLIAKLLAHSGDSWFWFTVLILGWWYGVPSWKSRSASLLLAVLITAVLVTVFKYTIRRKRPVGEWGKMYRITDPHSFPSGHAARAMMIGVLAAGLAPPWLGISMVIWGFLVGLARVAMGVHYLSDVVAGWLLGAVMGTLVLLLKIVI